MNIQKCKDVNCVCLTNTVTEEEFKRALNEEKTVEKWFCEGKHFEKRSAMWIYSHHFKKDVFRDMVVEGPFDCPVWLEKQKASNSLNLKKEVEKRKTFENFDASCLENPHVVEEIKEFPESHYRKLILIGKPGTGKTHLAKALMNEVNAKVKNAVKGIPASTLYNIFWESVMVDTYIEAAEEIRRLHKHHFIFIDDLGDEKHTDSQVFNQGFKRFFDEYRGRYIITSNLNYKAMQELYGEKITSRLFENAMIKTLKAKDYRLKSFC